MASATGIPETAIVSRAQGCLLGQLSGDSLGSLVEFRSAEQVRRQYPEGVRELADGGTWNTIAGQPTDDSEMALALARMIVGRGSYDPEAARRVYFDWLDSCPFDCGNTIRSGLRGRLLHESQANGAMMRVSPLGIFGAYSPLEQVAAWAKADAHITHPNPVCVDANALYTMAIAHAIRTGCSVDQLFDLLQRWANDLEVAPALCQALHEATVQPPSDYVENQGWVLIAFHNAIYQLLHAHSFEEGVVETVMQGGDTDTNAAIAGALLGAVYGLPAIPKQWLEKVTGCRPEAGRPGVLRPRPEQYWPSDALQLSASLLRPEGAR